MIEIATWVLIFGCLFVVAIAGYWQFVAWLLNGFLKPPRKRDNGE
jgi:hypothetical protein